MAKIKQEWGSRLRIAPAPPAPPTPPEPPSVPALSAALRHQLLWEWCDTAVEIPAGRLVPTLVAESSRRSPDAVAIVQGERRLSYGELGRRANGLARLLRAAGVGPDVPVALCAERSIELVIGLAAVFAAGGAYVPLDPSYPAERLAFLLADCAAPVLLADASLPAHLPIGGVLVLRLDAPVVSGPLAMSAIPAMPEVTAENLAYVIYTSGSTGTPKGVEIGHGGLLNLVRWYLAETAAGGRDHFTLVAGTAFDATVVEIWPCLVAGASLHIPDPETRVAAPRLIDWLAREGVTIAFAPTPLAEAMLVEPWPERIALRVLLAGGDRLRLRPAPSLPFTLLNSYGPTEITVIATCGRVRPMGKGSGNPSLGRALDNVWIHLLQPDLRAVPPGEVGEIWIGGVGLARGYHGRPDLTAERFCPDPWAAVKGTPGARLYRTGDLARHLPDGKLDFLGRVDHQIKLRGFRIELGEIEAALLAHPGVREGSVIALGEGPDARLIAFFVPTESGSPGTPELRAALSARLPEFMLPAAFVRLPALPLTPNGKVDRQALARLAPAPGEGSRGAYVAPRTPIEEVLAATWEELLGVPRIGLDDDFFALGGHSLSAIRVLSRLHHAFGVRLDMRVAFEHPTVARLAAAVERARGEERPAAPLLRPMARGGNLPLSFAQQRLWFLHRLDPDSAVYNEAFAYRLDGRLDPAALAAALGGIVRRHEALRTIFPERDGGPVQEILPPGAWALPVIDLAALPASPRTAEAARLAAADARRPFRLDRGPLFRSSLLRLTDALHLLLLGLHHAVTDGWSMGVLAKELGAFYVASAVRSRAALPKLPVQYADFAVWQRQWLAGEALAAAIAYWRQRLAGAPALLALPTDRPRPPRQSFRGAVERLPLGADLTARLAAFCRQTGSTPFLAGLTVFAGLLQRLTGHTDLVVGAPSAGRERPELLELIGFFVNTLVLRVDLSGEPSFLTALARVRESTLSAYAHSELPFERLVQELAPQRDLAHGPLFQVTFQVESAGGERRLAPGLQAERAQLPTGTAKFDLSLVLHEAASGLTAELSYATDLFFATTARRFLAQLARLLDGALATPTALLSELPLLAAAERQQLLREWGGTPASGPGATRIPDLVARQVRRAPDAVAVVQGERQLSYGELARRAGGLARLLRAAGVGPEVPVALCVERSAEMVIGLVAILQAGGAYLPLDPAYPAERLAFLLADSGAPVLVTTERLAALLPPHGATALLLDSPTVEQALAREIDGAPPVLPGKADLAYIIYTSGSTGTPKGVEVGHAALAHLVRWYRAELGIGPADRATQLAGPAFDATVFEIWPCLATGASLHVVDDETRAAVPRLIDGLAGQGITLAFLPTPLLEAALDLPWPERLALRTVLTGGDRLHRFPPASLPFALWNCYGPTEATVLATRSPLPPEGERRGSPSRPGIGRPIGGAAVHLLDRGFQPVPYGVVGEVWIGGAGLARGYRGRPELTALRFAPDPWATEKGELGARLYRTGDLARFLPDGELEFVGRADQQVKIRGFRIELGEVESALAEHPGVQEGAVIVRGEGTEAQLVAFLVPGTGAPLQGEELHGFLRAKLPDSMVPSAYVRLDRLPLTPHGKVDRRVLSGLAPARGEGNPYEAPRTPLEVTLAASWAELLSLPRVGRHDNFFSLGGHSLLATRVLARVRQAAGVELGLRSLFEQPTVAALARLIENQGGGFVPPPLVPQPRTGAALPLSYAQQRLWFLDRLDPASPLYNVPLRYPLRQAVAPAALAAALSAVVRRHEALRTVFAEPEGGPVQVILPPTPVPLPVVDLAGLAAATHTREAERLAEEEARRRFRLDRGPLLAALLLRLASEDHHLLLNLHHIVTDGWSMDVLARELGRFYAAFVTGIQKPLPPLPVQYADYALWQLGWLTGEVLAAQLAYWRTRLAGAPTVIELPTDRPRRAETALRGRRHPLALGADLAAGLRERSRQSGVTLFMTLLAGWEALLERYTGQSELLVGSPVANRDRIETEELIGFFVNTLVFRADLTGEPTVGDLLARVQQDAVAAFAHQDLPFEKLVEALAPSRSLSRAPLFQVLFALQGAAEPAPSGLVLRPQPLDNGTVKFDLALWLAAEDCGFFGGLEFRSDLFDETTVARLAGHLEILLGGLARSGPGEPVSGLPLLSAPERRQLVGEWNDTALPGTAESFPALFALQVDHRPEATALVLGEARLSYGELDARANRLAHRLRALGVGPNSIVGLCLPRSFDLVVGILAIAKAGGAFLPLDPAHPLERRSAVLADARAALLVDAAFLAGEREALAGESASDPAVRPAGESLAYVIYTSGSTGKPKGVLVEHQNLAAVLRASRRDFSLAADDVIPVLAPAIFDIFLFELLSPLAVGGTAVLVELEPVPDLAGLVRLLGRATRLHAVPALMQQLVERVREEEDGPGVHRQLRTLWTGGDAVPASLLDDLRRLFPAAEIRVLYGPTEGTILASSYAVPRGNGSSRSLLGRGLSDVVLRLYDRRETHPRLVPIGVPGEIWIGGAGVTRGYLDRAPLTAERFPWIDGQRWYRSGDLARRLADGNLEFLGRTDDQVKVRGFRVEPGEIEAVLAGHPEVREAVVLARLDAAGDRRLVASLVAAAGISPDLAALRAHLKSKLPDYMVPSAFVLLNELPLTPNGKVDRQALARIDPLESTADRPDAHQAPRTPVEQALAGLWSELLGRERVGICEDFFTLGGHSLLATRVLARVRQLFGVDLGIRALFDTPTIAGLAQAVEREREKVSGAGGPASPALVRVPRGAGVELPASFGQRRLWFLDRLQPGSALYNMPMAYRLEGPWEPRLLAASLEEIVRRHEALRTSFAESADGGPLQVIAPVGPELRQVDLSGLLGPRGRDEEERLLRTEARRPFDLAKGPLLRLVLLRWSSTRQTLLLSMHHAISDGGSVGVLLRELGTLYTALRAPAPPLGPPLPELPVQYADFAVWQRQWLAGPVLASQLAYWRERLAGHPPVLELPADRPRPPVQSFRGEVEPVHLGTDLTRALVTLSRQKGTPLFMTVLAGWLALLGRYTGQEDLLVGVPSAGRTRVELENLIGFFVNLLAVRTDLSGDPAFAALLTRVRESALGAYAHGDLPLERLVEELAPERSLSYSPLFQVAFDLAPASSPLPLPGGLRLEEVKLSIQAAKFDLTLGLAESAAGLVGDLEYSLDLFDATTARRMAGHLRILLAGAVENPDLPLSALPLLARPERAQALWEWNDTARPWPDLLVHETFAEQARRQPGALAVVAGAARLTYGELEEQASRLAARLRSLGVGPEVPVAVCAERSAERVVGVVAVLKAGGAFVSLDPTYPRELLASVLAEIQAPVVLSQARFADRLPASGAAVILLDQDLEMPGGMGVPPPASGLTPDNLAYVIFTSGSTGRPKGVAVPHAGLLNLVRWYQADFGLTAADRVTQVASPAFDASVWELWPALAAGASVHVPDEETRLSAHRTARWWATEGITLSFLPTPLAEQVLEEGFPPGLDLRVRSLATGGDRLRLRPDPDLGFRLTNHYGPAESSVVATAATVAPRGTAGQNGSPSIGRAIYNTHLYVLDVHLVPVPLGVPGELCITGQGLARGYLGRPDLTAERFLPDPWGALRGVPGARMYRTGDLVRRRVDGDLDFVGRADHQVKLRGMRVELGEIEANLLRHPGVRAAVVAVREDRPGDRRLAAYVVPALENAPAVDDLAAFVERLLPAHMVPQDWLLLPALPLTANGKLDRRALPAPERRQAAGTAPGTPLEERLARIYGAVLGVERVSVEDDFFDLGGHSLLATQVVARVRQELAFELPVRALFEEPTIAGLARRIAAEQQPAGAPRSKMSTLPPPLVRVARGPKARLPLSFAQQRLWFIDRLEPGSPLYNIPAAYRLEGVVVPAALAAALAEVVRRHEALRTTFTAAADTGNEPVQVIAPAGVTTAGRLWNVDLGALPAGRGAAERERLATAEAERPFDLSRGPLLRTTLVRLAATEHVLLLTLHHVVADGWSMGVLLRELSALYGAAVAGQPSPLSELPVQYADFALWQRGWMQGEVLDAEIEDWRRRLAGVPAALDLPTDRPRPAVQSFRGASRLASFPPSRMPAMTALARALEATPFMVALAAFQALLGRYTRQTDVAVGSPIAGRTHREIEGLIGFFVNTLVLRTDLAGDPTFADLVSRVREVVLQAHAHQNVPFERLVEALEPERSLSHTPLFQVMFLLQSAALDFRLPGLALTPLDVERRTAKFDLLLGLWPTAEGLEGGIEYSADLFDATTAERILRHFDRLLTAGLADPRARIADLALLAPSERAQVLAEWNDSAGPRAPVACLHDFFTVQAGETPDRMALVFGAEQLTYGELAARTARLASFLVRQGVGPEVPVAISVARSLAMIEGLLAIFRAGGYAVTLDPTYPAERLAFMLADAAAPVLLADTGSLALLPPFAGEVLCLDSTGLGELLARQPAQGPAGPLAENLAYVIHTSGSTGKPKGIAMSHRAIVNVMEYQYRHSGAAAARTLQFAPLSFDVCYQEIFSTWAAGGTLLLISDADRRDPLTLLQTIERHEVCRLDLPFVALESLAETAERLGAAPQSLLEVIAAGEQLRVGDLFTRWFERMPRCRLENQYGPSEAHVVTALTVAGPPAAWPALPPVGRPILSTRVHLLDARLEPVPIGVTGEIHCGGVQLARGYLGRPDLTAERFLPDPFAGVAGVGGEPGGRLYKTGDLARTLPGGDVEFLGRLDFQVKVRGFRIELGEIEAVLADHPAVSAVVVEAPEIAGLRRLVAYVVPTPSGIPGDAASLDGAELRRFLADRLPAYMVPSHLMVMEALPIAATGKVDRRALPLPERLEDEGYVAPRTPLEEEVAVVWTQVLGVARVGIHDSFWDLGGHSLLATKMLSRLHESLGVALPLQTLFKAPTIAGLTTAIGEILLADGGEDLEAVLAELESL
ncbi:MAG TPA: non-ribosomal peptide synthase/polyketide synthase [Thermoanaerobaculia bacterium]|nr:non-ribosomal peptide synthase/polyketide synthase [Thermoanaerobaculia bacterium]